MQKRIFLLVALALLPLLTRAQAEPAPTRSLAQRLSLTASLSYNPTSSISSLGGSIWPRLSLGRSSRFSAGLMIEGTQTKPFSFNYSLGRVAENQRETYGSLFLTGSYALGMRRFRPLVGLGVGLAYNRYPRISEAGDLIIASAISPALNLHLGADYRLSDRWGLHARIQSDYIFRPNDNRINIPLHLGASYRFGR